MKKNSSKHPKLVRSKKSGRPPVRIGVICPSRFEYEAIRDLAVAVHAAVRVSGMGKVRSACAAYDLHRQNSGLEHVLLVGFAGGLLGLEIGDLIEPRIIIEQDYCAEPFEKFPNQICIKGPRLVPGAREATLLTQDRFVKVNPYAGTRLAGQHPRLACDMEGYAVACACRNLRLGCSVLKLISDKANSNADHDFLKACKALRPKLRSTLSAAIQAVSKAR